MRRRQPDLLELHNIKESKAKSNEALNAVSC